MHPQADLLLHHFLDSVEVLSLAVPEVAVILDDLSLRAYI